MAENRIPFVLDLDGKEFEERLEKIFGKVEGLGDALKTIGVMGGVLAASYLAFKTALDLTFEAEQLKSMNAQFEILSKQAGIVGSAFKEALDKAAGGLISDNDLIQIANKSLAEFGSNAERLPEMMELARKAAVIFGGDTAQAFETMSHAVATGSTRALKNFGIVVDSERAYRDFAAANGVAANALSESGRQQAIMNEVLSQGKTKLGSVDVSLKGATDSWTILKNTIGDIKEVIALAFDKTIGPSVRRALMDLADFAKTSKNLLESSLGTGAVKAAADVALLEGRIAKLQKPLDELDKKGSAFIDGTLRMASESAFVEPLRARLEAMKSELEKAKGKLEQENKKVDGPGKTEGETKGGGGNDLADSKQQAKNQAAFQKELANLDMQRINSALSTAQSVEEVDRLFAESRVAIADQTEAKIAEIKNRDNLDKEQKNLLIAAAEEEKVQKLIELDQRLNDARNESLDNHLRQATKTSDGIARSFSSGSRKASLEMNQFGNSGARVFQSFQNHAVDSLQAWGAGTKTASEAARGFILGMLADEALARGTVMLMSSVWPPNPVGLAGGAALIAFAGFLKSQAGGSGGGSASGGSGGASSAGGVAASAMAERPSVKESEAPKKMVTIQIHGNYFETEESRRRLAEMVREHSDATDFNIMGVK